MSDTVMGDTVTSHAPNMAGAALRAAREKAAMSVEEAAAKLKLSPRQIVAIEAEDWANLPERTFTRGFFYSYARLLGIDKKIIDTSFTQRATALGEMRTMPAGMSEVTVENTTASSAYSKWLIPGIFIALLLAGVAWFLYKDVPLPQATSKLPIDSVAKAQPAMPTASTNVAAAAQPSVDAATAGPNTAISAGPNAPLAPAADAPNAGLLLSSSPNLTGASGNNIATSTSPSNSVLPQSNSALNPSVGTAIIGGSPATAAPSPTSAAAPTTAPVTPSPAPLAAGERRVKIESTGRSWSEARASGDVVLSEMLNASSREFVAKGPISFVIGNSSNVKLTIDGKPYDFSPHVRNEVARFRVE